MSGIPKAIIFDMDGLMIDSEQLHHESFSAVLTQYGITPKPTARGIIHTCGISADANWEHFKKQYNFIADTKKLTELKNSIHFELLGNKVAPMPGLLDLLNDLKQSEYRLAIASSSIRKHIDLVLKHLEITDYFDVITSGEEVINGKPAPDIFLKAARRLSVEPHECIVLEDASNGIQAAKAAGMYAIAVPSEFTRDENFNIADAVVPSLSRVNSNVLELLRFGHEPA